MCNTNLGFLLPKSELLTFQKHNWDFYFRHVVSLRKRLTLATERKGEAHIKGKLVCWLFVCLFSVGIRFLLVSMKHENVHILSS